MMRTAVEETRKDNFGEIGQEIINSVPLDRMLMADLIGCVFIYCGVASEKEASHLAYQGAG